MSRLDELLERAGIRRADLARRLGITPNAVTAWAGNPPKYAEAYLLLLVEYNRLRP